MCDVRNCLNLGKHYTVGDREFCEEHKFDSIAVEDTQGLIRKDLLLE